MTPEQAIAAIDANWPTENYTMLREALTLAKDALRAALVEPPAEIELHRQHRRDISELMGDAGVPGGTTIYGGAMWLRERAEKAEAALADQVSAALVEPGRCTYGDPLCPCPDGDTCHYEDTADTKAMVPPVLVEPPADLVALVLAMQRELAEYAHTDAAGEARRHPTIVALLGWEARTP